MKYTKKDRRRWFILQCRYYNGEEEVPKEIDEADNGLCWSYECHWVNEQVEHPLLDIEYEHQAKELGVTLASWDKTPLSLKLLLFGRYLHWSSGYCTIEEELQSFDTHFYAKYVSRKTNKERRTEERTKELVTKCKIYKGRWSDPCVSDKERNFIWQSEKEWVEKIADSYSNRQCFFNELMKSPCLNSRPLDYWKIFAHKNNIPATLLACLAKNYAKEYKGGFMHEMEDYFEHFICDYSKM